PLGVLLVRAGLIRQDQLDAALGVQQKTLKKLGDLLIADGAISKEELKNFLSLQTRETINRLFRWKMGEYEFIPQAVKYDVDVATPMSPEHVLMDGFRMMDEWPAVLKKIRALESIIGIPKGMETQVVTRGRPKPGEEEEEPDDDDDGDDDIDAAFAAFDDDAPKKPKASDAKKKIKLTGAESVVWALIDSKRTVQDIVDRSLLGEFDTCNAIAGLMDKGVAQVVGRRTNEDDGRIPVVERPRGERMQLFFGILGAAAVLVVSVAAVLVLGLGRRAALTPSASGIPDSGTAWDAISRDRALRATEAGDLFFLRHGRWPKDLDELSASGLLAPGDLAAIDGRPLVFIPPSDSSAGRVALPGT
ncbi:MAG TPA: DUF4388 domain-containing protein, partial [bacterium]|nr:DUF4388 domain-containing protein [bacterium]